MFPSSIGTGAVSSVVIAGETVATFSVESVVDVSTEAAALSEGCSSEIGVVVAGVASAVIL